MGHWMSITTPYNRHLPMCQFCKIRGHKLEMCPKLQRKQQQKKENLKSNKKETIDLTEKEKRITTEISLAEFVPKRKRIKNENSKITSSTPKRKKKRNNNKRISNLTSCKSEYEKEINEKLKHKKSNIESKSNQSQEMISTTSTKDVFETIANQKSIIHVFSISDTEIKKKKEDSPQNSKSFKSYKDVVLNKL